MERDCPVWGHIYGMETEHGCVVHTQREVEYDTPILLWVSSAWCSGDEQSRIMSVLQKIGRGPTNTPLRSSTIR